ncbi:hypothetical protein BDZ45DRAFT_695920 [Acephala macrosclerotiorum]|nr:hypothetical protein BDZ45DRAFT_695920 [Acephala macrosclerotiorum]
MGGFLGKDISEKSAGVFLCISLVVRSLLEGLANSDRLSDLSRRLALMPEDLDGLYTNILQSLDRFYFEHASQLIQIVHQCSGPISLLELSFADEEDPQTAITTEVRPATDEEKKFHCDTMKRWLNSRIKGLLEVPALRSDREDEDGASGANNLWFNPLPPNYRGPNLSLPSNGNNDHQYPGPVHSKYSPDDLGNLRVEYLHLTVKDFFESLNEDKLFGDDNMWRAIRCCWDYANQAEATFYGSRTPTLQELERVAIYLKTGPSGSDIFILPSAKIDIIMKRSALLDHRDHLILSKPVRNLSKGARQYLMPQMQAQDADGTPILSLEVLEFETFAVLRMRLIRTLLKYGVNVNREYRGSSPWKDLISVAISDSEMRQIHITTW